MMMNLLNLPLERFVNQSAVVGIRGLDFEMFVLV
jgi:hypothetical protein